MTEGLAAPWEQVWGRVADELDQYRVIGLDRLLTEDVVRFAAVRAMVDLGVAPARIYAEWRPTRNLAVDLALDDPVTAAVEFKFPREPQETNAAWTQHLGELLKDFYRLAALPPHVTQRWCVQLLSTRLRRYLDGVEDRYHVRIGSRGGEITTLTSEAVQGLPPTARRIIGDAVQAQSPILARCQQVFQIGRGLLLVTHLVEPRLSTPHG